LDQHGKRADGSPYNRKYEGKTYAASIWEDLGGAMAVLCLVSTLAMADEMTCTAGDGKGNCTAATGPDGKVVVVVGEGVKVGEKMDCMHKGSTIDCKAITKK